MIKSYHDHKIDGSLVLSDDPAGVFEKYDQADYFKFIWARRERVTLTVDGIEYHLAENQIISLTPLQRLEVPGGKAVVLLFNREFYCIHENDHEVSCEGLIFWGSSELPVITLDEEEQKKFDVLLHVFNDELETRDKIQGEMLRMLLKRFIIKCTRLARNQLLSRNVEESQIETIRKFNLLVEKHFRDHHKVSEYAGMMNKSPKTLSNIFSDFNKMSPLEVIHNRLALEAKRLLLNTDLFTKEIAYDIGFDEPAHFSRFFKKETGQSPTAFRKQHGNRVRGKN